MTMTTTYVKLTAVSSNSKTGPIPVSTTSENSCPKACPLREKGCYGNAGPINWIWKKVTNGITGGHWDAFVEQVARLGSDTLWRHNQVGDLPHDDEKINVKMTEALTKANKGRKGFTFCHHEVLDGETAGHNRAAIKAMNADGFTVNLSADTLAEADAKAALNVGPVVTVLPKEGPWPKKTPEGRSILVCLAVTKGLNCQQCQLCQKVGRKSIVGFPAHGKQWRAVDMVVNV